MQQTKDKIANIDHAIAEAERFLKRAKPVREELACTLSVDRHWWPVGTYTFADVKRSAVDLGKTLSAINRPTC